MLWSLLFVAILFRIAPCLTVTVTKTDDVTVNGFNMVDYITKFGYPIEVHKNIATKDGYLLDIHRIPHGKDKTVRKRGPVLIMHGLVASADSFVVTGPKHAIGFLLAERGYDVWIGNARGTTHSLNHVKLDSKRDGVFWDFSWHEIGVYDLPALIQYILKTTQQSKLHYMGHSQGTTIYFVMSSERPEFNNYIKSMVAMAPSAFLGLEFISMPLEQRSFFNQQVEFFRKLLGINQVGPQVYPLFCNKLYSTPEICDFMMALIAVGAGGDPFQLNFTMTHELVKTFPDSASAKQALHYMQSFLSANFSQYDYGPDLNMKKYKSLEPPAYNLKKITRPVGLFFGLCDTVATLPNVQRLRRELPNVALNYLVPYPFFTHLDFVVAKDVVKLLYNKVFSFMSTYD